MDLFKAVHVLTLRGQQLWSLWALPSHTPTLASLLRDHTRMLSMKTCVGNTVGETGGSQKHIAQAAWASFTWESNFTYNHWVSSVKKLCWDPHWAKKIFSVLVLSPRVPPCSWTSSLPHLRDAIVVMLPDSLGSSTACPLDHFSDPTMLFSSSVDLSWWWLFLGKGHRDTGEGCLTTRTEF